MACLKNIFLIGLKLCDIIISFKLNIRMLPAFSTHTSVAGNENKSLEGNEKKRSANVNCINIHELLQTINYFLIHF